ncbi:hypothetical protein FGRMN_450 [Fusarium graminum]|nr:hypothetical protein FGRMN_450 [Fusarium graminum]
MEFQLASLITLPTEVLTEILKEVLYINVVVYRYYPPVRLDTGERTDYPKYRATTQDKKTLQNLKSLRLAHRRFAQCDVVNRILFSDICLEPTRGSLASIQRGDFSHVASYVRSVTFATPPSWTLPRKTYDRILSRSQEPFISTPPRRLNEKTRMIPQQLFNSNSTRGGYVRLLSWTLEPSAPFLPEALRSAYDAYMTEARYTQALLQDSESELKQTWIQVLRSLGDRLERVRLLSYDCEEMRQVNYLDAPDNAGLNIPWRYPRHDHEGDRSNATVDRDANFDRTLEYSCTNAAAVAGDKLFATVIACLAASGVAIPHLSIQMFMTGDLECKTIPGWNQVDFSKLKELHISPKIPYRESGMAEWQLHLEQMKIKFGDFCHDLLDKCHSSIQHFCWGIDQFGQSLLCWPTRRPTYDFPELTHLTQKGNIAPAQLAHWLLHLKNLRHLQLSGEVCRKQYDFDMRFVLNAIRDHSNVKGENPKGLKIDFDGLDLDSCVSYSGVICRDASMATKRLAPDPSLGYMKDVKYALEAHFYGEVPLQENKTLQCFIDQWGEELRVRRANRVRRARRIT